MSALGLVLGSLLRDIAQAQDISNEYSAILIPKYEKDPWLRYFPVPNAVLTEVDLELKFAISHPEDNAQTTSVIVEADKLAELDAAVISSVKFKTVMRSFKWTRPDDEDGQLPEHSTNL